MPLLSPHQSLKGLIDLCVGSLPLCEILASQILVDLASLWICRASRCKVQSDKTLELGSGRRGRAEQLRPKAQLTFLPLVWLLPALSAKLVSACTASDALPRLLVVQVDVAKPLALWTLAERLDRLGHVAERELFVLCRAGGRE